jgi:hypothetical protein
MRFLTLAEAVKAGIAEAMARELLTCLMGWAGEIPLIIEMVGDLPGPKTIGASGWDRDRSCYLIRLRDDAPWWVLAHEMGHIESDHIGIGWPTDWGRDREEVFDDLFEQVKALDPSAVARIREQIRWETFCIENQADDASKRLLGLLWDEGQSRGFYLNMGGGG